MEFVVFGQTTVRCYRSHRHLDFQMTFSSSLPEGIHFDWLLCFC